MKNPTRALVITGIFPPDHGGPASYVPRICNALIDRAIDVKAVITLSDKILHDDYKFQVMRIQRSANRFKRILKLAAYVRRHIDNVDVIYVNGLLFESMFLLKVVWSKPVVVKIVGDVVWEISVNKRFYTGGIEAFQSHNRIGLTTILKAIRNHLLSKADGIIVPSKYLQTIVQKWVGDKTKLQLIYNSVDEKAFKAEKRLYDVVTVCRLVPWKGVSELIDLCIENRLRLNIVGDGPLRNFLESRAIEFPDLINFTGALPQDRVASEISKGRIFVLNSSYEGLPHVILEAMLVKVPVIATNVGGTSEIIVDDFNGYLVHPTNTQMLNKRVCDLIKNPNKRFKFTVNAMKVLRQKFSSDNMYQKTLSMLEDVAQR